MASLDLDVVRHALKVAQDHGYAEVELGVEGSSFRARFDPTQKQKKTKTASSTAATGSEPDEFKLIKSPIVGYYRDPSSPVTVGTIVSKGDVVAVINALGIANDVESTVAGEVVEVLVKDGQSVEFGQVLAKVKA